MISLDFSKIEKFVSDQEICNMKVAATAAADTLSKLGVQLIDHVIVADADFVSMAQSEQYGYIFVPR